MRTNAWAMSMIEDIAADPSTGLSRPANGEALWMKSQDNAREAATDNKFRPNKAATQRT